MPTQRQFELDFEQQMFSRRGTLYKIFEAELARSIFSQIHQSYVDRSRGRTNNGEKWADLERTTKLIKRRKGYKSTANLINIRTRRGINSYKPGKTSRFGYKPFNPDQLFKISGPRNSAKIKLGSKIRYLRKAEVANKDPSKHRFFLPKQMMESIVQKATVVAKAKVMKEIKRRYNR